ncbi:MAG: carbon-nitrogen hydrolase family protein [Actinomycetota bacterium]|nr:carbon-nitrogen hydrolase family protein [Actinomycetota bacterium]
MRVTVCQLPDNVHQLDAEWSRLVEHCRRERSELVLLPEMPFSRWLAASQEVDQSAWMSGVVEHDSWRKALTDLVPAIVIATQPVLRDETNHNEGFVWSAAGGYRPGHLKYYLPNESGFWEAEWYERGPKDFSSIVTEGLSIGFLICTELWFTEHARAYAKQGLQILATPRATGLASADKWLAGGRAAAVMSGAFCLSSNRDGTGTDGFEWAGQGWIIEPEDGDVLGLTTDDEPFVTVDIDLDVAAVAKTTYPRYVRE